MHRLFPTESARDPVLPAADGAASCAEAGRPFIEVCEELFVDVQMAGLFSDSKTFVDAVPRIVPAAIALRYDLEKGAPGFSLADFVGRHFSFVGGVHPEEAPFLHPGIARHIQALWPRLTRPPVQAAPGSTQLELRHPYVVPGGRFNEIYYWDSYFTMLGLIADGHGTVAQAMLSNFADLVDRHGHVPNGTRSYYLSRSQPPFLFKMAEALAPDGPGAAYARLLAQLKAEHAYWMAGAEGLGPGEARARVVRLRDGSLLNRYWDDRDGPREESYREDVLTARASGRDPRQVWRDLRAAAESGWDFSSRWCAEPARLASIETTSLLPVDLNALLCGLENAIALGCAYAGDGEGKIAFALRAARRREAIDRHLWCEEAGHYVDFHWVRQARRPDLTAATAMPLFLGLSTPVQAARVAQVLATRLLTARGLVTTQTESGQQWDFPNGWAPLQWIAVEGLRKYGIDGLARTIAGRWTACVDKVYRETGRLMEKYDVIRDRPGGGGEYDAQCGFGWTNGVQVMLSR